MRITVNRAVWTLLLPLAGTFALAAPARADRDSLRTVQQLDQIVADIGYRLQSRGGDLCLRAAPLPGFAVHNLSQYYGGEQEDARALFGFTGHPLVLALAKGSAAEAAGLRVGDALLAIDGQAVPPTPTEAKRSYDGVAQLLARIDAAAADGSLDLELRRDGQERTLHIALAQGCPSRFQTNISNTIDSAADGTYVEVNSGLIAFAQTEDQLAAIMAHELAHNILRHRERLNAAGITRGLFGQFGRSARLTRATEEEADRLSVYLLDRAGYDPLAAVTFWERYRKSHPLSVSAATHMGTAGRIELIRAETARIAAMKAAGKSPRPAFMEGPGLPRLE